MSIIYEALEKTQQKLETQREPISASVSEAPLRGPSARRMWPYMIMAIFLSIAVLYAAYAFLHQQKPVPAKPQPSPLAVLKAHYVLNGVLVNDDERTAVINNHIYHIGDKIDAMKIIAIDPNQVILQKGQQTLALTA